MITTGIIGCGAITQRRHAVEYAANPSCTIGGFYDFNAERAQEMAAQYGGKAYKSVQAMLEDRDIDAVSVCTSNATHAEVTVDALRHGKHVLCEKPMSTTTQEALAMQAAEKEAGRVLMLAHNQRFDPVHIRAKELLEKDEIGRVIDFEAIFAHGGPEYWSIDPGAGTWFFKKEASKIGAMGDLGVHKIDLMMWLLESPYREVTARISTLDKKDAEGKPIGVDDNAACLVRLKNGIAGKINVSWTYNAGCENSVVLYGSTGVMRIHQNDAYPITITRRNGEQVKYTVADDGNSGVIDAFIHCLSTGTPSPVNSAEGIHVMKVIEACLQSSAKGRAVQIGQ